MKNKLRMLMNKYLKKDNVNTYLEIDLILLLALMPFSYKGCNEYNKLQ